MSRAVVFLLVLAGSLFAVASPAVATPMKTNRVILDGTAWLGGAGVPVYSNDENYDSHGTDLNYLEPGKLTGYRWQCVELVNRLYRSKGWVGSYWLGHGSEMYDNAASNLGKSPQGSIDSVGPGDVIVFSGGTFVIDVKTGKRAGHVAVVDSVSGNTVRTVNQNYSTSSDQVFVDVAWDRANKKLVPWNGFGIIGIVHAPDNIANRSQSFVGTPADGNVVENITPGAGGHYYVAAGGVLFWFNKNDPTLRTAFIGEMQRRYSTDHPLKMAQSNIHAIEANYPTPHAHRPNNNTFLHERGSQTQFVVQYGYAFEITGSTTELAFLNGLGKATMVPVNSISPLFANAGAMPDISPGRLLKSATSPDFYEVQAGYLYHANNMTVVDCLAAGYKVQGGIPSAFQPVPLTLLQAFLANGRNANQLATCQMPDDVVFFGAGGAERWQITGSNPYARRKYASTLAIHCYRGPAPTVREISPGGINAPTQGPDIHCPNNTYLRNNQTGQAFQWWDGQLHYIASPEMLSCLTQGNTSVVIPLNESAFGGAPQGAPAHCQYEGKLLQAPNGQVFWVKDGARRYVGNAQILNCLSVRANAGSPIPVPVATVNSYTLGTNAYCTYPADIRFVRGDGQAEVWRVFTDGTRQHAGSLCQPQSDPRYYVHVVPAGEVDGHQHIGTFDATPTTCAAIS